MAIQNTAQIYDISTMSRATNQGGRLPEPGPRPDRLSPTMSYPQRIAAMLAHAPQPPKLRRVTERAAPPLTDETKAMLISVHTLNATPAYTRH